MLRPRQFIMSIMLPFAASHADVGACTGPPPSPCAASDARGGSARSCGTAAALRAVQALLLGSPALCEAQAPGEIVQLTCLICAQRAI